MKITSSAFEHNQPIPSLYTCDGKDINPPLTISDVPLEAQSLVLIHDDPDAPAGLWVHWLLWNIDPKITNIAENSVPKGAVQGTTSWNRTVYGGACPPNGQHRYFFKLYALDITLDLAASADKTSLETAMKGHILAEAELVGVYERQ